MIPHMTVSKELILPEHHKHARFRLSFMQKSPRLGSLSVVDLSSIEQPLAAFESKLLESVLGIMKKRKNLQTFIPIHGDVDGLVSTSFMAKGIFLGHELSRCRKDGLTVSRFEPHDGWDTIGRYYVESGKMLTQYGIPATNCETIVSFHYSIAPLVKHVRKPGTKPVQAPASISIYHCSHVALSHISRIVHMVDLAQFEAKLRSAKTADDLGKPEFNH